MCDGYTIVYTSANGRSITSTPHDLRFISDHGVKNLKKVGWAKIKDLVEASHGRVDWSFEVFETNLVTYDVMTPEGTISGLTMDEWVIGKSLYKSP